MATVLSSGGLQILHFGYECVDSMVLSLYLDGEIHLVFGQWKNDLKTLLNLLGLALLPFS